MSESLRGAGAEALTRPAAAGALEHPCPTCHAPVGERCRRSPGRSPLGRRRNPQRRPHLARVELATTSFSTEEGRRPGLRQSRTSPSLLDALSTDATPPRAA
jgi:hypothetical protein